MRLRSGTRRIGSLFAVLSVGTVFALAGARPAVVAPDPTAQSLRPDMVQCAPGEQVGTAIFELDTGSPGRSPRTPLQALDALLRGASLDLPLDRFDETAPEPGRAVFELNEDEATRFITEAVRLDVGWVASGYVACSSTLLAAKVRS